MIKKCRTIALCGLLSLMVPLSHAKTEDNAVDQGQIETTFWGRQIDRLIPPTPNTKLLRDGLAEDFSRTYRKTHHDEAFYEQVSNMLAPLNLPPEHVGPTYKAARNLYSILGPEEDARYIMQWATKFLKAGLTEKDVWLIVDMIHHYLTEAAPADRKAQGRLLPPEALGDASHPLHTVITDAEGWNITGQTYVVQLKNRLSSLLREPVTRRHSQ